ncbi:MAG: hypothetical protein ACYSTY_11975 [Planctomycetota bacterium]
MNRGLAPALACVLALVPGSAHAQRFGGDFGGAGGFWMGYIDPGIEASDAFGRDPGGVLVLGGRVFVQTGKVRLGGGIFGGGFVDGGLNPDGNEVDGRLSAGGFTFEYLAVQQNFEVAIGGLAGGGVLTVEEKLSESGGVENLRRRRDSIFVGYPWLRLGYNPAPLVNVGLELGYFFGSRGVGGPALGLDILVGLIP